ncbi:anthocyanidin 3-O-glucosyltransferase 7-like [Neltuma alba]|uniref:anthocyanidin 3-O-glucosyltransferase 7-like n=1 Tax=Neltuma alba TaxID=207710 RepID=UPI0010A39183|nr:anthocyanidin 3-O-glucosyltransferase 7-like [Prosopis alba]
MTSSSQNKHIAAIVFPFGSHQVPFLNLVIRLAQACPNVTFSFISTAKSNQTLFSRPSIPGNIKSYDVSDGIAEGHVLGAHPFEKLNLFLQAGSENLQKGIDLAVKSTNQKVTCILANAFVTPSLIVAQNLNVPWIALWPPLSTSLSVHFYTNLIRQHCADRNKTRSLDFLPGLSQIRLEDIPGDVVPRSDEEEPVFSKSLASMGEVLPHARAVVISFYEELDLPLFVQDMKSKLQSMLYIGPLTLSPSDTNIDTNMDPDCCLPWLDKQGSSSVVYISFGTVVAPPQHELLEVSEALEASGFPFLWSLKDDQKSLLPNGFVERTNKRGKIVSWAPQAQVLANGSIGVFVTHCGNSSLLESMANGVPLICRPFFGDQGMATRLVEDIWKIGVKIEGGVFTKNGLIQSLNLILVDEEGKKIRENTLKVKETMQRASGAGGKAEQDFKTLVEIISSS